jgi:PII-like signaling protein
MHLPSECILLRIFIGENDRSDGRLLYEIIVESARRRGLAGATVLRGILGFGAKSRIHTSRILRLSQDLPVVVEIVDTKEKIDEFLPELDILITEGMVTIEKADVLFYRHSSSVKGE